MPMCTPNAVSIFSKVFFILLVMFDCNVFLPICAASVKNVTLVSVHVGANPLYGYYLARPAYEVAVRHIRRKYPLTLGNLQYRSVYQAGYDLCGDGGDHVVETFAKYYYDHPEIFQNEGMYPVLASPECSSQALQLADLAREHDLPFFTSVAADLRLTNKARYSTNAATASLAGPDVGDAIAALLKRYSWRTITLICDSLSRHVGLSNFFTIQCSDAKKLMKAESFPGYVRDIDSSVGQDYVEMLQNYRYRSRVFVLLTLPVYVRRIMITASALNMTSGEFAFITIQPTERPGIVAVTWNQKDDEKNNSVAFQAYRSLIVLSGQNPNWTEIKSLTDELVDESQRRFNMTILFGNERNEQITSVYESTMMFAQIFNESYPEVFTMPKSAFIKTYFNREFNFAGRTYATDKNGGMVDFILVSRLNVNTTNMEIAMVYNATSKSFVSIVPELWKWVDRDAPPPDKPLCGFKGDECDNSDEDFKIKIGASVAAVCTVLLVGSLYAYCRTKRRQALYDPWWILDADRLSFDTSTDVSAVLITKTKRVVEMQLGRVAKYNAKEVYALNISNGMGTDLIQHIAKRGDLLTSLYQLHSLQHSNVARFIGIVRHTAEYFLIAEHGPKATLRQLIERESMPIDKELRLSLLWDLVEGLDYLHQSSAGLHGNLTSLCCILDARYGLKIAQAKYNKILHLLQVPQNAELESVIALWKSPDLLLNKAVTGTIDKNTITKESDIYSMGIIFYEIYTRSLPYGAAVTSVDSVEEAVAKMIAKGGPSIFAVPDKVMPERLQTLLRVCVDIPNKRPTIQAFRKQFRSIRNRPSAYLLHIMKKLEKHAEELEDMVAERNRELETEMHKADTLLREMLPASIVRRLRNKQTIAPELFESTTIMFSDIPVFQHTVVTFPPLAIITFLNTVYSHFDHLIDAFDVYKVETISDSYVMVSGLPVPNGADHGREICKLAIALVKASRRLHVGLPETSVQLRIGINTGPVVAAVIGKRMPRYCLFGDTMNTASRMESNGQEGKIHISMGTKMMIEDLATFATEPREPIHIKGKGVMHTFWLVEKNFV
ncbi:atrial natriuretic peptide receptor 1-like [Paramacrobiotus metropolitanus]|uniref:atrial natriuretic peptide receptor 1-like n=1 Tax=Paramacrobiotus metropolitanus TaxID=2943436 RepID=UPI0024456293|nr:atrial natriuretic peptide receptor 1-like [Paramacrobiotus metropolitanus]